MLGSIKNSIKNWAFQKLKHIETQFLRKFLTQTAPLTYKQPFKRNACGFHFLCVWVMNTDIFSHEFCYGGSLSIGPGRWRQPSEHSLMVQKVTDGTAFDNIWDVELILWQIDFTWVDLVTSWFHGSWFVTSWPHESWLHGNWPHESWLCERKSFYSSVP